MYPFTIRLWLRLIFPPTLIFVLIIALIRSQPYDDSQVRELLLGSEDCPAPCFMGIRPGVTTAEEAIDILNHHEWVANGEISQNGSSMRWDWSGKQPQYVDEQIQGALRLSFNGHAVEAISISTKFDVGDAYLLLGKATETDSGPTRNGIYSVAIWFDYYLSTWTELSCPGRITYPRFWQGTMNVDFFDESTRRSMTGFGDIHITC